jgi:FMN phosphatase YigB (HAD superfamily)
MKLVIFDAFNTLVTAHPDYQNTFLDGLAHAGLEPTLPLLTELQAASEGTDHSAHSRSRDSYVAWASETLCLARQSRHSSFRPRIVPALEQLHQAPMIPMSGAEDCLAQLKNAGFKIAICSNWDWDLRADLRPTGLARHIDTYVPSARAGFRKPHPRIYQAALDVNHARMGLRFRRRQPADRCPGPEERWHQTDFPDVSGRQELRRRACPLAGSRRRASDRNLTYRRRRGSGGLWRR